MFQDHSAQVIGDYIRRAREERELAGMANSKIVAQTHLDRANAYEAMIMRFREPSEGYQGADDYEASNFVMSSQRLFPFHARGALPRGIAVAV